MMLVRRISNNSEQRDAATKRPLDREETARRKRERGGERERINKEGHNVVRNMINVADRERNRTSRSGTKAAFGLTLQGSVAPLPHGRRRRDSSIGRHPVSFSILLERSVSCAYHDTHLAALISYFNEDASVKRYRSQIDWTFIRIRSFSDRRKRRDLR